MARLQTVSASGMIIAVLVILNVVFIREWYVHNATSKWCLVVTVPLLVLAIIDMLQNKHAVPEQYCKTFKL